MIKLINIISEIKIVSGGRDWEEEWNKIKQNIIEEEGYSEEWIDKNEDLLNRMTDDEFEDKFGFPPNKVL